MGQDRNFTCYGNHPAEIDKVEIERARRVGLAPDTAEGGFDIPAGLNPVTQLHEREMVLPASIAEPLRSGIGGGAQAGGDIHIHAVDAASFQRLLSNNKGALAKALRGAHRAFDPSLI